MKYKGICLFALIIICSCLFEITGRAQPDQENVLAAGTEGTNLVLYVKNPGGDPQAECLIGTGNSRSIHISPISEDDIPLETIFLVDNSLSVQEKYRSQIRDILTQLAANRMNGEVFSVGVFSTQLTWILENSSDYSQIKTAIDSITYQDQETYLTDVLYEMLKSDTDSHFKRIVIISDGVDNKAIGYTKEELYNLIASDPCPIYTLGCTYKDNQEELKNMFALSRMTQGESWLLDDVSDEMDVVSGVSKSNDTLKVVVTPEDAACDGTTKGVNLQLTSEGQTVQYILEMRMPFAEGRESSEPQEDDMMPETEESTASISVETEIDPIVRQKEPAYGIWAIIGIIGAALIAVLIILLIKKKKTQESFQPAPDTYLENEYDGSKERETFLVDQETENRGQRNTDRQTYLAWGKRICLTDQNDPDKKFEAFFDGNTILIGYNAECQIRLNYDESVSGRHCSIYGQPENLMIQNLSKTNPTLVNNQRVNEGQKLENGDILTIGRLKLKFEIDP